LRVVDRETGKPISRMLVRLFDASGAPIVHGHGSGNFFERTDEAGQVRFGRLPAGTYAVRVLGRSARINDFVEYASIDRETTVSITEGEQLIEIEAPPRNLEQAEIDKRFPFSIFGRVTDEKGDPLAGVEIRAATGVGTLIGGGRVVTDADGRYRLYFRGGVLISNAEGAAPLGSGVQAAHFYAKLEGWELPGADGSLRYLMTDTTPADFKKQLEKEGVVWGKSSADEVVFAHEPREINLQLRKKPTR
jgi:hypothetical protein